MKRNSEHIRQLLREMLRVKPVIRLEYDDLERFFKRNFMVATIDNKEIVTSQDVFLKVCKATDNELFERQKVGRIIDMLTFIFMSKSKELMINELSLINETILVHTPNANKIWGIGTWKNENIRLVTICNVKRR